MSGPRSSSRLPATGLKCASLRPEPCTDRSDRSGEEGVEDEGDRRDAVASSHPHDSADHLNHQEGGECCRCTIHEWSFKGSSAGLGPTENVSGDDRDEGQVDPVALVGAAAVGQNVHDDRGRSGDQQADERAGADSRKVEVEVVEHRAPRVPPSLDPAPAGPVAADCEEETMASIDQYGGWSSILAVIASGSDLSADQCEAVFDAVLSGQATDAQIAAFIVGIRLKGETIEEMTGLQRAMIAAASPLVVPADTIDIVGVGGAQSRRTAALNVSTMASFVAAGAGATVCKHGNRRASSTSGSFDLLEALGVRIDIDTPTLESQVNELGIGFAFARTFHPAMRHVGLVRAELGIPTLFNILGPLSHPARLTRQVIGVADVDTIRRIAEVLRATGSLRSLVVHGTGGLDELTTTGPSTIVSLDHGEITESEIDATHYGLARVTSADIAGGDAETNARIARQIFAGEPGPARDIVVLNAGAGLWASGVVPDLAAGVTRAAAAIDDGRAAAKLDALVASA